MNGVEKYDRYVVDVFFESNHACCEYCPMMETYSRKKCNRTGEFIIDSHDRGHWCPLIKVEDDDERNSETESGRD